MANVATYIANIGKSIKYSAFDHIKDKNPVFTSFKEDNGDIARSIYNTMKDVKAKGYVKSLTDNKVGELVKLAKNNMLEDLKSGKLYNREREEKYSEEAANEMMGMNDSDFGFGEDDYNYNDELDVNISTTKIIKDDSSDMMDKVGSKVSNAISKTVARSSEYIVTSNMEVSKALYSQQNVLFGKLHADLGTVNQNIAKVLQYNSDFSTTHYNNSKTFYESTTSLLKENNNYLKELVEIQRKYYQGQEKRNYSSDKRVRYSDIMNSDGGVRLEGLVDLVKQNIQTQSMGLGDMASVMFESGAAKSMTASPLKAISTNIAKAIIPKVLSKTMEDFNKTLSGSMAGFLMNIQNSYSGLPHFLSKFLGIDTSIKTKIGTNKYNKEAIPFDGVTKKAIIEVIPTYLSKILAAVSDAPIETRYDYDSGKFITTEKLKKELDRVTSGNSNNAAYDIMREFEKMSKLIGMQQEERELFEKDMEKFFQYQYKNAKVFNPKKNVNAKTFGMSGDKKSEANLMIMKDMWNRIPNNMKSQYADAILNQIENQNSYMRNREASGDDILTAILNGSIDDTVFQTGNRKVSSSNRKQSTPNRNKKPNNKPKNNKPNTLASSPAPSKQDREWAEEIIYSEDLSAEKLNILLSKAIDKDRKRNAELFGDDSLGTLDKIQNSDFYGKNAKRLAKKAQGYLDTPVGFMKTVIEKADQSVFDLIFGLDTEDYEDGLLHHMLDGVKSTFSKFNTWMDENILNPIDRKFDKQGAKGAAKTFFGLFGIDIDDTIKKAKQFLFGTKDESGNRDKNGIFGGFIDSLKDSFKGVGGYIKKSFSSVFDWLEIKGIKKDEDTVARNKILRAEKRRKRQEDYDYKSYNKEARRSRAEDLLEAFGGTIDYKENGLAKGTRRVEKTGVAVLSEGEMVIPPDLNPYNIRKRQRNERLAAQKFNKTFFGIPGYAAGTDNYNTESIFEKHEEDYIENPLSIKVKNEFNNLFKVIRSFVGDIKTELGEEVSDSKLNQTTKENVTAVFGEIKKFSPDMTTGAIIGGGLSLVTGLLGSPIIGAAAGAAVGLTVKSERVQKILFGEIGEDGERDGGLIPKKIASIITKYVPSIAKGATVGGITSLIPFVPGGPVAGIIVGSAVGFASRNQQIQEYLFGEEGKLKGLPEKLKSALPKAVVGAIGGSLVGPFGLGTNILLGSVLGFAADTNKFKDIFFGEVNADGNREGGVLGTIKDATVEPMRRFFKQTLDGLNTWMNKSIVDPLKRASDPIKRHFQLLFRSIGTHLKNLFDINVGAPLKKFLERRVLGPLGVVLGGAISATLGTIKTVVAAPFKTVGRVGDVLRKRQIKAGKANYMSAEERLEYRANSRFGNYFVGDETREADETIANMTPEQLEQVREDMQFVGKGKANARRKQKAYARNISKTLEKEKEVSYHASKRIMKLVNRGDVTKALDIIDKLKVSEESKQTLRDTVEREGRRIQSSLQYQRDTKGTESELFTRLKGLGFKNISSKNVRNYEDLIEGELKFRGGDSKDKDKKKRNLDDLTTKTDPKQHKEVVDTIKEVVDELRKLNSKYTSGGYDEEDMSNFKPDPGRIIKAVKSISPVDIEKLKQFKKNLNDVISTVTADDEEDLVTEDITDEDASKPGFLKRAADFISPKFNALKDKFTSGSVKNGISSIKNKLTSGSVKAGVNSIKNKVTSLTSKVNFSGIKDKIRSKFGPVDSNRNGYALGGVVAKTGLAVVSKGEKILSGAGKLAKAGGSGALSLLGKVKDGIFGKKDEESNEEETSSNKKTLDPKLVKSIVETYAKSIKSVIEMKDSNTNANSDKKNESEEDEDTKTVFNNLGKPIRLYKDKLKQWQVDKADSETKKNMEEAEQHQNGLLDHLKAIPNKLLDFFGGKDAKDEKKGSNLFAKILKIAGIATAASFLLPKLFKFITEKAAPFISDLVGKAFDKIKTVLSDFKSGFVSGFSGITESLDIDSLATKIGKKVGSGLDTVRDWFAGDDKFEGKGFPKLFEETLLPMWLEGFEYTMSKIVPKMAEILITALPSIVGGINNGLAGLYQGLLGALRGSKTQKDLYSELPGANDNNDETKISPINVENKTKYTASSAWNLKGTTSSYSKTKYMSTDGEAIDLSDGGSAMASISATPSSESSTSTSSSMASNYTSTSGNLNMIKGSSSLPAAFDNIPDNLKNKVQQSYLENKDRVVTMEDGTQLTVEELLDNDEIVLKQMVDNTTGKTINITGADILKHPELAEQLGIDSNLTSEERQAENAKYGIEGADGPLEKVRDAGVKSFLRGGVGTKTVVKGLKNFGKGSKGLLGRVANLATTGAGYLIEGAGKLGSKIMPSWMTGADKKVSDRSKSNAIKNEIADGYEYLKYKINMDRAVEEFSDNIDYQDVSTMAGKLANTRAGKMFTKFVKFVKKSIQDIFTSDKVAAVIRKITKNKPPAKLGKKVLQKAIEDFGIAVAEKVAKYLGQKAGDLALSATIKISGAVGTGGLTLIATGVMGFASGVYNANAIIGIEEEPDLPLKLLAGAINCISELALGLIPSELVFDLCYRGAMAAGILDEGSELEEQRTQAQLNKEKWDEEHGTESTMYEYLTKDKLTTKVKKGIKNAAVKGYENVKNAFSDEEGNVSLGNGIRNLKEFVSNSKPVQLISKGIDNVTDKLGVQDFIPTVGSLIKAAAEYITGRSDVLPSKAVEAQSNGESPLKGILNILGRGVDTVSAPLALVRAAGDGISKIVSTLASNVVKTFKMIYNDATTGIKDALAGDIANYVDTTHYESEGMDGNPMSPYRAAIKTITRIVTAPIALIAYIGGGVARKIDEIGTKVGSTFSTIKPAFMSGFDYAASGGEEPFKLDLPEGSPVSGFTKAIIHVGINVGSVVGVFKKVGNAIHDKISPIIDAATSTFSHVKENVNSAFDHAKKGETFVLEKPKADGVFDDIVYGITVVPCAVATIMGSIVKVGVSMKESIGTFFDNFKDKATNSLTTIDTNATDTIRFLDKDSMTGYWNYKESDTGNVIFDTISKVVTFVQKGLMFPLVAVRTTVNNIQTHITGFIDKIKRGVTSVTDAASNAIAIEDSTASGSGIRPTVRKNLFVGGASGLNDPTFVSQNDPKYANKKFNTTKDTVSQTVSDTGCAPAAATMIINSYGRGNVDMMEASKKALPYKVKNDGVDATYFSKVFKENGIDTRYIPTGRGSEASSIVNNLATGNKVVLMGQDRSNTSKNNSPFGPNSHYVVANGLSEDGKKIYVNDPELPRGNAVYDTNKVLSATKLGVVARRAAKDSGGAYPKFAGMGSKLKKILGKFVGRAMVVPGNSNREKTWNFLRAKGFSEAAAAGAIGNLMWESGGGPTDIKLNAVESTGEGVGMVQWSFGRKTKFLNYLSSQGATLDTSTIEMQLSFMLSELEGSEWLWAPTISAEYGAQANITLDQFKKLNDIALATRAFCAKFERCYLKDANLETRTKWANAAFTEFTGKAAPISEDGSTLSATTDTSSSTGTTTSTTSVSILDKLFAPFAAIANKLGLTGSSKSTSSSSSSTSSSSTSSNTGGAGMQAYLDKFKSWLGAAEGTQAHKDIIDLYNKNKPAGGYTMQYYDAWCQACVSAAAQASGNGSVIPNSVNCGEASNWFKSRNQWKSKGQKPAVGDIVYYQWNSGDPDHVGAVTEVNGDTFNAIEGNYQDSVAMRNNVTYNGGSIYGFGTPQYAGSGSGLYIGRGSKVPSFISQLDSKYANKTFNINKDTKKQTVRDSGCAPAAAAMAINMANGSIGNKSVNFNDTINNALKYKLSDDGVTADYFVDEFKRNNLGTAFVSGNDIKDGALKLLGSDRPVILLGTDINNNSKTRSPFGTNGHYVVATGLSDDGTKVFINDPESDTPDSVYDVNEVLNGVTLGITPTSLGTRDNGGKVKKALSAFKGGDPTDTQFPKYNLNDRQIAGLANICAHEQPTQKARAAEASLMANLTDIGGDQNATVDRLIAKATGGWFAHGSSRYNNYGGADEATKNTVRAVLVDGKRTIPRYVNEHDYIGDIGSVTNNGVAINKGDKSQYIPHVSIITQNGNIGGGGGKWIYYSHPDEASDPFGYTSADNRSKWGDGHYNFDSGTFTGSTGGTVSSTGTTTTTEDSSNPSVLERILGIGDKLAKAFGLTIEETTTTTTSDSTSDSTTDSSSSTAVIGGTEKQKALVNQMLSIENQLNYASQSKGLAYRRNEIHPGGWGDCSSTVQWAYNKVLGVDIGSYTGAQLTDSDTYIVKQGNGSGYADPSGLAPGDILLYGPNASRHVEMYMGDNKMIGHGGGSANGMGPYQRAINTGQADFWAAKRWVGFKNAENESSSTDNTTNTENDNTTGSGSNLLAGRGSGLALSRTKNYNSMLNKAKASVGRGTAPVSNTNVPTTTTSSTVLSTLFASNTSSSNVSSNNSGDVTNSTLVELVKSIITILSKLVTNTDNLQIIVTLLTKIVTLEDGGTTTSAKDKQSMSTILKTTLNQVMNSNSTSDQSANNKLQSLINSVDSLIKE